MKIGYYTSKYAGFIISDRKFTYVNSISILIGVELVFFLCRYYQHCLCRNATWNI